MLLFFNSIDLSWLLSNVPEDHMVLNKFKEHALLKHDFSSEDRVNLGLLRFGNNFIVNYARFVSFHVM